MIQLLHVDDAALAAESEEEFGEEVRRETDTHAWGKERKSYEGSLAYGLT